MVLGDENDTLEIAKQKVATLLSTYTDVLIEKESVLSNGGFYIGRYEVGEDRTIKKGNVPETNITNYEEIKTNVENMYNDSVSYGVKSSLPSGASYCVINNWFLKNGTYAYWELRTVNVDLPWANTSGSEEITGDNEQHKLNNIYNIGGNACEISTLYQTTVNDDESISISRMAPHKGVGCILGAESTPPYGYRPILYFR